MYSQQNVQICTKTETDCDWPFKKQHGLSEIQNLLSISAFTATNEMSISLYHLDRPDDFSSLALAVRQCGERCSWMFRLRQLAPPRGSPHNCSVGWRREVRTAFNKLRVCLSSGLCLVSACFCSHLKKNSFIKGLSDLKIRFCGDIVKVL